MLRHTLGLFSMNQMKEAFLEGGFKVQFDEPACLVAVCLSAKKVNFTAFMRIHSIKALC